ncbi:low molecular weight protein-tyrosine-phosphatase [Rhodobium gokarnense]|uniref:protein-tyrosine-phosphatase n=1 Tax=Rhodobium gokarnense TaxID=364296 RepID=A0ABT3H8M8_9HYPH|nr:low molecular weight protein-tyrosine-phosphatase [Rhodobium gokarnense]MCW2306724.1 protein-tyrosine phosphatase [Rhodobium gokarnense]
MRSVLFVCLGNICRSPLAEGAFRAVAEENGAAGRLVIDSAGTSDWNLGQPPEPSAIRVAAKHGIDISHLRARQLTDDDFFRFDLILAMDEKNLGRIEERRPSGSPAQVALFLEEALGRRESIADPYGGTAKTFATVFDTVDAGAKALYRKHFADT